MKLRRILPYFSFLSAMFLLFGAWQSSPGTDKPSQKDERPNIIIMSDDMSYSDIAHKGVRFRTGLPVDNKAYTLEFGSPLCVLF